jgi:serine/threonine-protein kinase
MPTQQAQQLGRYYLLDRVAFGGMAEIFRAKTRDAQGKEVLVAVKRVLAHLCEDDEFIQMLIDEARLTALLKHPNIARVYEFSKVGHEYFIAMEYVEGKDMRALLERARQNQDWLPEDIIALIGSQVALGLHVAYEQHDPDGTPLHIVHRDVSPSNVLLSYAGDVKLCDFGIAKAEGARQQTRTGVIKGKVKYMSPEQAMGRTLNNRSVHGTDRNRASVCRARCAETTFARAAPKHSPGTRRHHRKSDGAPREKALGNRAGVL